MYLASYAAPDASVKRNLQDAILSECAQDANRILKLEIMPTKQASDGS